MTRDDGTVSDCATFEAMAREFLTREINDIIHAEADPDCRAALLRNRAAIIEAAVAEDTNSHARRMLDRLARLDASVGRELRQ